MFLRRSRNHRFQSQQLPPSLFAAQFLSAQGNAIAETTSEEQQVNSNAKSRVNLDRDRVIMPWSQDFNAWYLDVIANAKLADYGPVRGTMVIHSEILENYFFDFWIHSEIFFGGFCYYFNILAYVDVLTWNILFPKMETKDSRKMNPRKC